jgi:4-amino-4-deoxy-L-arabinose transferase-like glycosyltransferase
VALLYALVRRAHGAVAGLLAAGALAVSPVAVQTQRNNTMDALLVLVLLLAAGTALRAVAERGAERTGRGQLGWLLARPR